MVVSGKTEGNPCPAVFPSLPSVLFLEQDAVPPFHFGEYDFILPCEDGVCPALQQEHFREREHNAVPVLSFLHCPVI